MNALRHPGPPAAGLLAGFFLVAGSLLGAGDGPEKPGTPGQDLLVYVGTYTGGKSEGIYVFRMDGAGKAGPPDLAAKSENPSFLAIHPRGRFLYSVNEVSGSSSPGGKASAFSIDQKSGKLTFLNQVSSGGSSPCHLVVDSAGRNLLVANYGDGRSSVIAIEEDGRLGPARAQVAHTGAGADPQRQKGPHAHSINLDPSNRFAVVADLGLDRLVVYRFFPERGALVLKDPPSGSTPAGTPVAPGAGPRHFAFHPGGRFAYVINEMSCTVTAFAYDGEKGELTEVGSCSTLPGAKEKGYSTAEVQVHPSGKFLYGSNRGHDSIAVFSIDPRKGALAPVEHQPTGGKTPRNFGIDPAGKRLLAANQGSGTIVVFAIDPDTGRLRATGEVVEVPAPVCVKFLTVP